MTQQVLTSGNCECGESLPWHLAPIMSKGNEHVCSCGRKYVADGNGGFTLEGTAENPFAEHDKAASEIAPGLTMDGARKLVHEGFTDVAKDEGPYYVVFAAKPLDSAVILEMVRAQLGYDGMELKSIDEYMEAGNSTIEKLQKEDDHHVDNFIDDFRTDIYASWVLNLFRLPAILQMKFADFIAQHQLFCTYEGTRYRVTGASRMGDVWLAENHERDSGYDKRVSVKNCSDWGSTA